MNAKKPKPVLKPRTGAARPDPTVVGGDDFGQTGRVTFDDRGNAVWEWALGEGAFSTDITSSRLKKLEHPSLSIAADPTPPAAHDNPLGSKVGYNPYGSGKLSDDAPPRRKKDLRRLSESLQLKRQYEARKKGGGTSED
jgi:hypothetical protein